MFLGVEPIKCLLTEAGCWPFHFQLLNTPIYVCVCVRQKPGEEVCSVHILVEWASVCVCVCSFFHHFVPLTTGFSVWCIFKTWPHAERERDRHRVRDEIHPIPLLLLSQEVWRWHASTWRSRRASCVRRRCCWARPTRTSVWKLRSKPESWVRLRYFIIRDDQLGDAPWLVDKLYSIFYAHLQVAHNCKHQQF